MVDENIYLRYYEIKFQKYIMKLYTSHNADKAQTFFQDSADILPGVSTSLMYGAVRRILSLDSTLKIFRDEFIVCLGMVEDLSKGKIRKIVKCSPNVVYRSFRDYDEGQLHIQPRFDIITSREIVKYMEGIYDLFNLS